MLDKHPKPNYSYRPVTTLDSLTATLKAAGYRLRELDAVRQVAIFYDGDDVVIVLVGSTKDPDAQAAHQNYRRHIDN